MIIGATETARLNVTHPDALQCLDDVVAAAHGAGELTRQLLTLGRRQVSKCLITDYQHVLITSANFTSRGQDRNIEVGIVVHDSGYASALERQWNNLVESGDVVLG